MMDILQRITEQRLARNWSEFRLASQADIPQSTISSWYRKDMLPSLRSLEKICRAFDMSLAQFFSEGNCRELDASELELIENWELLSPNQKKAVLNLLRSILEERGKEG